jgi:F0F1-type ATP synthase assembly protein I
MSFRRLSRKAFSYENHDGLQLFVVVVFVVLSFVFSRVAIGMSVMEGGLFPVFPNFLVSVYLFNHICNFQAYSDVRISLMSYSDLKKAYGLPIIFLIPFDLKSKFRNLN